VIAAFEQVPAMQNELKVCRFLVGKKVQKTAKRKTDQEKADEEEERHKLTKQEARIRKLKEELEESQARPYHCLRANEMLTTRMMEDIGSEGGSQDEADDVQDEVDEEAERAFARHGERQREERRSNRTPDQILREQLSRDPDVAENRRLQKNQKARERRVVKKENGRTIVVEDDDYLDMSEKKQLPVGKCRRHLLPRLFLVILFLIIFLFEQCALGGFRP